MKLVAYCRVSSLSQEDNGSLQHQEAGIRRYCDYHKHELVEVLHESKTGKNTDRKQFQKMLDLLPEVDGVIAFKIDRISRSVKDLLVLVEDVLAHSHCDSHRHLLRTRTRIEQGHSVPQNLVTSRRYCSLFTLLGTHTYS